MADKSASNANSGTKRRRAYKISVKRAKLAGVMCLALVCTFLLFISPLFNIKSIYVTGTNQLTSEEVLSVLDFSKGDNIFAIDTTKATKEVMKLSRVDSCTITRTLPGKVTLSVNEKTESGYIKVKSGYAGIDETGKVLVVTKSCEAKCPLISGITIADPQKDDYIKCEEKNAKEKTDVLITLLTELSNRSMIPEVKSINIKDTKNISLTLVTKTIVNLGENGKENKDTLEYKIAFLKAILEEDYPKNGGIIELSDTSNVTGRVS